MAVQSVPEESYNQAKMVMDLMRQEVLSLRVEMPKQLAEQANRYSANYKRLDSESKANIANLQEECDALRGANEQLKSAIKRLEADNATE